MGNGPFESGKTAALQIAADTGAAAPARRQSSLKTRCRILDAAEELFAEVGYDGTSIRDVSEKAGVRLALVAYHVGNKETLFDQVIARRASVLGEVRMKLLENSLRKNKGAPLTVEEIITCYVSPFIQRSGDGGKGWRNYTHLVARLANAPNWDLVIGKYYDPVARRFIVEFRRALPTLNEIETLHRFSFMMGVMLAIIAEPGRVERLSENTVAADDLDTIFRSALPFVAAGFRCLPPPRSRGQGAKVISGAIRSSYEVAEETGQATC